MGLAFCFGAPLLMACVMFWLKRKLPGWGEPPASDDAGARAAPAAAPGKNGGARSTAKKMANAAICAATTASAVAGGVAAVDRALEEGVASVYDA